MQQSKQIFGFDTIRRTNKVSEVASLVLTTRTNSLVFILFTGGRVGLGSGELSGTLRFSSSRSETGRCVCIHAVTRSGCFIVKARLTSLPVYGAEEKLLKRV